MSKRRKGRGQPRQGRQQSGKKIIARPVTALVDIIMPVYGEWGMLARAISCIPAAAEGLEGEYRIIVLDNGTPGFQKEPTEPGQAASIVSPEEMAAPIKEMLRKGKDVFVRLEENVGYPGACNDAASRGNGPLICIVTSDVYLEPGAITTMVREMDDPEVGVVGPLLLFPLDESPNGPAGGVQSAGISFNVRGDPFHVFIAWSPDNPRVKIRREMQGVTGACFMTRRSLWQQIGGFWPGYGVGTYEDLEFCFSVRSMGLRVIFVPEASGFHYVGGSIRHGAGSGGFPLGLNSTIFKGRWAGYLAWDEFRFL